MVSNAVKNLYSSMYCQAYSAEAAILAVGSSEGRIILLSLDVSDSGKKLTYSGEVQLSHADSVYSLASTPDFCLSGTTGTISGRCWTDLKNNVGQTAWTIQLECDQSNFGTPEVNALAYDPIKNHIYAGCGDWRTHVYDVETSKLVFTLNAHEDYVHDVVVSGNMVGSCSEDGNVFVWDLRGGREPTHRLTPHSLSQLSRPHLGHYVSSVDLDDEWLVCGGGPKAGVFHLRSMALISTLPWSQSVNVAKFTRGSTGGGRGSIVVAGDAPKVQLCNIGGDIDADILSSSTCVYTINIIENPSKLMTFGGSGTNLDVCYNENYRDHVVSLLPTS